MAERSVRKRRPQSLYDVLQVTHQAEPEVIQASYRVLARLYHPDVSRDPASAARMRELNAAYDVLRDPARRAEYDGQRAWAAEARRAPRTTRATFECTFNGSRAAAPLHQIDLAQPTFRGRLVLLVLVLLGALTLVLWLLLELLNDGVGSTFPG